MSTYWIAARMARRLVPLATGRGRDPQSLLREVGLDAGLLEDPHGRVPQEPVLAAIEALLASCDAATLGLDLAANATPDAYHTPALVMMASDSLREGLTRAFELQRLWGDGDRFELLASDEAPGAARVAFHVPGPRRPAHDTLEICALVETMAGARMLAAQPDAKPLAWGLPSPAATFDVSGLESLFGAPTARGVPRAFVTLDAALLDAPIPTAHALYRAIFEQQATSELARLPDATRTGAAVRELVGRALPGGRVSLERCATQLGVSARTLERRLAHEATTFAAELDAVRRARAEQLLGARLPIDEVATLLGYSERSAFHRACMRWFGKTPAELRDARAPAPDGRT